MLFVAGEIKSIGRVDTGDTVTDFLPQERERGITINSAIIELAWKNALINLIDTPGHVDFTIEVERSCRVLDGIILVIDAVAGVQAQTKTVWKQVRRQSIPSIAFINKMVPCIMYSIYVCEDFNSCVLYSDRIVMERALNAHFFQ